MSQKGGSRLLLVLILAILAVGVALLWMNRFRYDQSGFRHYRTNRITGTVEILNLNEGKWRAVPEIPQIKAGRVQRWLEELWNTPPTAPAPIQAPSEAERAWQNFNETTEALPATVLTQLQGKVKLDCLRTVCEVDVDNRTTWSLTDVTLRIELLDSSGHVRIPAREYSVPMRCISPGHEVLGLLDLDLSTLEDGDRTVFSVVSARGSRRPCPASGGLPR